MLQVWCEVSPNQTIPTEFGVEWFPQGKRGHSYQKKRQQMLNVNITNSHDMHLHARILSNSTLPLFLTWSSNQLSAFSPPILTRLPTALNLSTSTEKEEKAQTLQWFPLVQPIKSKALDLKLKIFPALTPRGLSSLGPQVFPSPLP